MKSIRLVVLLALLSAGFAIAQAAPTSGATQSVTYNVPPVGGSGVFGTVVIGDYGPSTTVIAVSLEGTSANGTYPAHFHLGDCGSGGDIEMPLSNVAGYTGLSVAVTDVPYERIVSSDYYLNVHRSPDDLATILACGEVGAGVQPVRERTAAGAAAGAASEAAAAVTTEDETELSAAGQPPADPGAEAAPDTASYGLFPVAGSGISGQVQLTDEVQDGTKFVVTLVGIDEGQRYPAVLYRGDCGPDRPRFRNLDPVGERPQDPFVSITDTDLGFDRITSGDYFLYIFESEERENVVACGEVGAGANR